MPKRKSVDDESDAIAHPQPQPPRRSLRHKPASEQHESESVPPKKENKNKAPRKPKAGEYGTQEAPSGADRTQDHSPSSGKQYWLMKAEPESRLEKGVDVKFSIDDLAAKTEPEPWDGIRNYVARNNLRSMKRADLAFFYHSNCKEPAIVGTMEVVQEHSPDLTAHDPNCPYYDASSKPSDPKWSLVHVKFRSKFAVPIPLSELKTMGKPVENLQVLKQSRLSVSKVSPSEWDFLINVAEQKASHASQER